MISLKWYLDMPSNGVSSEGELSEEPLTALRCYRAILLAMGRNAIVGCPAVGLSLDHELRSIADRISIDLAAESLERTRTEAEARLEKWGKRTELHLKEKANDAKELLLVLAETVEAVSSRDEIHANHLRGLTDRLRKIGGLDDLAEIRSTLMKNVTELKESSEQISAQSKQMLAHLRVKVSTYEHKLKEVEFLVLRDELTGLANRRSVEERIQRNIANGIQFCVFMLDLDGFKQVNDRFGHQVGDDLLKQFAAELNTRSRISDLVGRWGGDEFIVIYEDKLETAIPFMQRIQEWVFGKYNLHCAGEQNGASVEVTASIGVAEWGPGETQQEVIARADREMYVNKNHSRSTRGHELEREAVEVGAAASME